MQIISVMEVRDADRRVPALTAFIDTDEYNEYIEDAQVCGGTDACVGDGIEVRCRLG